MQTWLVFEDGPRRDHLPAVGLDTVEPSATNPNRCARGEGGINDAGAPFGIVRHVHHIGRYRGRGTIDVYGGREIQIPTACSNESLIVFSIFCSMVQMLHAEHSDGQAGG